MEHNIIDRNGKPLEPGTKVVHALAKHVLKWPPNLGDLFIMEDGVELLSHPFAGTRTVDKAVSSTCVRLLTHDRAISVFLGEMLEVAE